MKKVMILGFLLTTGITWAQTVNITIPNYSFEGIASNTITSSGAIGAWNASASNFLGSASVSYGTATSLGSPAAAPNGTNVVRMTVSGVNSFTDLNQILTTSFLANSIYTLTFYLNPSAAFYATLSLNSGNTTVASLSSSQLNSMAANYGSYSPISLTYTNVSNGGPIGIDFAPNGLLNSVNLFVDDFTLTQVPVSTPEPNALALTVLGAAGAYLLVRRRMG